MESNYPALSEPAGPEDEGKVLLQLSAQLQPDDIDFGMEWACMGILDGCCEDQAKEDANEQKRKPEEEDPSSQKKVRIGRVGSGWRKYGQKTLKGKEYTGMKMLRCYYRCNYPGCPVKKQVETSAWSTDNASITISGVHNHPLEAQTEAQAKAIKKQHVPHLNETKPTPPLDQDFADLVVRAHPHFVVCDPHQNDCPIIFASSGFLKLTGYTLQEVVGRNCRFLQGKDTNIHAVRQLKQAITQRKEIHIILLNYKKDGSPFWNLLHISPITDNAGKLHSIIGSQLDVSGLVAAKGMQSATMLSTLNATLHAGPCV